MTIDDGLISFARDWIFAPALAAVAWIYKLLDKRISSVEEKAEEDLKDLRTEVDRHRDVMAKIFDKLEEMKKESHQQFTTLLTTIHQGLDRKADK